jgi:L-asparagine transporter-like permease
MAQTKKKRRTKHRGNAAGVVENRGRTGRKPTGDERKLSVREEARARRLDKSLRLPTWRAAVNRAAISAVLFVVLVILLFKQDIGPALGLGAFVFLFYIPLGYFTDKFVYERKLRKQQQQG